MEFFNVIIGGAYSSKNALKNYFMRNMQKLLQSCKIYAPVSKKKC
jgi:hypothetical protein